MKDKDTFKLHAYTTDVPATPDTQYNDPLASYKEDFPPPPPQVTPSLIWFHRKVILTALLMSFAGFLFGYDTGILSGMFQLPSFIDTLGSPTTPTTKTISTIRHGLMVGLYHIGCITGGFTYARLADFKGRRIPIMLASITYCAGNLIQLTSAFSGKWYQYMIGRYVSGICVGSNAVLVPMLVGETAPTVIRGSLMSLYYIMITTGIVTGSLVIYAMKKSFDGKIGWILPMCLSMGYSVIVILGILFSPESPRFLVSIGDVDGARRTLISIGEQEVEDTLAHLQSKLEVDEKANEIGYWEMITTKKYFKRLFMGMVLMFMGQLTGIDYFFFYGTQLFADVGLNDSYITMIIIAAVNHLSSWTTLYIVEKFGRKKTLLVGAVASTITLTIYATVGVTMVDLSGSSEQNRTPGLIMIVFTCLYIIQFNMTWSAAQSTVVTESFPLHIRSKALGVCIAFNWAGNFFIGFCTPIFVAKIQYAFGFVFVGCMVFSFFFILIMVKETKGVELEEIEELFKEKDIK